MSLLCSGVPFGYIGKLRAKQLVLWHHYWCFALSTRSLVLVWCANISSTTVRDNSRLMHYSDEALKLPVKANGIGLVDSCGAHNSTKRTTIWFLPSLTWSKTIVAIINHWAYQRWSSLQPHGSAKLPSIQHSHSFPAPKTKQELVKGFEIFWCSTNRCGEPP